MEQILSCPKCGSSQITANKKGFSGKKAIIGDILVGPIGLVAGTFGSSKVLITCLACGHRFKPGAGRIKSVSLSPETRRSTSSHAATTASAKGKGRGCLVVFIALLLIGFVSDKLGCNKENDAPISNTAQQITIVPLTKTDSSEIRKKLKRIYIIVDSNDNALLSPLKKYVTIVTNNLNSYEKKYEVAKNTKIHLQNAKNILSSIQLPENLPEDIKNTLRSSFSTIAQSYSNLIDGINIDVENKLRFLRSDLPFGGQEDFNQEQDAADSIDGMLKILIDFGMTPKEISKLTHKKR